MQEPGFLVETDPWSGRARFEFYATSTTGFPTLEAMRCLKDLEGHRVEVWSLNPKWEEDGAYFCSSRTGVLGPIGPNFNGFLSLYEGEWLMATARLSDVRLIRDITPGEEVNHEHGAVHLHRHGGDRPADRAVPQPPGVR